MCQALGYVLGLIVSITQSLPSNAYRPEDNKDQLTGYYNHLVNTMVGGTGSCGSSEERPYTRLGIEAQSLGQSKLCAEI